eukprot:TRINITY_DN20612_c0_g1_i1.p1 TRINITY_DN20612_c0_g1~~TRINITY_DN20612_c0_g1_i1.p1  ORF type:complete len:454 (+),score=41.22 TRINITY_DN20612_c0_g1_i1:49-1410(+)
MMNIRCTLRRASLAIRPQRRWVLDVSQFRQGELVDVGKFGLSKRAAKALEVMGFSRLYPVQAVCYDEIAGGRSLMVRSNPGSGKTLAYVLPVVEKVMAEPAAMAGHPSVLILVPTKELVYQVTKTIKSVGKMSVTALAVTGKSDVKMELEELGGSVDILVGTPGRVSDLLGQKKIHLDSLKTLVIDEADITIRGAIRQLHEISNGLKENRGHQTVTFSATVSRDMMRAMRLFNEKPVVVNMVDEEPRLVSAKVTHQYIEWKQYDMVPVVGWLVQEYWKRDPAARIIVFVNSVDAAHRMVQSDVMKGLGVEVEVMSSAVEAQARQNIMKRLSIGELKLVISTDVLSRGINVPDLNLVVSTGVPKDVNSYVYRSGRTGRADAPGHSVIIISPGDNPHITHLERTSNITIHPVVIPPEVASSLTAQCQLTKNTTRSRYSSFGSRGPRGVGAWGKQK